MSTWSIARLWSVLPRGVGPDQFTMAYAIHWCFTLNNYTELEYQNILSTVSRYIIVGKEIGAEGTPHLQGYIAFEKKIRLTAIKKKDGFERAHLESSKGTPLQASDYCKKDGDFVEKGDLPLSKEKKGAEATKRKWQEIVQFAKEGKQLKIKI